MYDLTRSYFNDMRERPVIDGANISEEGQLLAFASDGAGGVGVQPCLGGVATEKLAGFAITDALKYLTETVVEQVTVPVGGGSVNLRHTNIVASSARVVASVSGPLVLNCPTPGAGDYCLDNATGIITFDANQAGETVTVSYRYTMTLEFILNKYHERGINNRAQDFFSSVSCGTLDGEIFTSMYNTAVAYAAADSVLSSAGGLVTTAAGGTLVGFVTQVPSVDDGLLGVKFSI